MLTRMMNDFAPLFRLQNDVNRLFESLIDERPASSSVRPYGLGWPALNTWEDGEAAYVEAELPGMTMDDVEVYVLGRELTVSGERKIAEPQGAAWHRRERSQGRFSRTLALPWDIDADRVEARLQDGVLSIKLPKAETSKPKKVKVLGA